jgi:hypothetical protein
VLLGLRLLCRGHAPTLRLDHVRRLSIASGLAKKR